MTGLSARDIEEGFVRPVRTRVQHTLCKYVSELHTKDALDMARDPKSWSSCYCFSCGRRLPAEQFTWHLDGSPVGS